ncbi:MAG: hypothetical protein KC483_10440 [Nitrosarchaeum sp.]|nr:hypothetical protein [Nitrosarchaeum sp.]
MPQKKRGLVNNRKLRALIESNIMPRLNFFAEQEIRPILKEIKNQKHGNIVRVTLTNYLLIRTITFFEIYMKTHAYKLAKDHPSRAKNLFYTILVDEPIQDQVVSSFNFSNLGDINTVFTSLHNVDNYLEAIKYESETYGGYFYEDPHIKYTKPLDKNWNQFKQIFELRNDIVHSDANLYLKYSEIRDFTGNIIQFILCSFTVAIWDFPEDDI